jgi:hypothetical protein
MEQVAANADTLLPYFETVTEMVKAPEVAALDQQPIAPGAPVEPQLPVLVAKRPNFFQRRPVLAGLLVLGAASLVGYGAHRWNQGEPFFPRDF